MRNAMANAPVGDDVYGEDPTVNRLEGLAAELTGKQAGLFVASGTMGNLAAILTHARRGDEAIVADTAHTLEWEAATPPAGDARACPRGARSARGSRAMPVASRSHHRGSIERGGR